jgi:hypothetical protein
MKIKLRQKIKKTSILDVQNSLELTDSDIKHEIN